MTDYIPKTYRFLLTELESWGLVFADEDLGPDRWAELQYAYQRARVQPYHPDSPPRHGCILRWDTGSLTVTMDTEGAITDVDVTGFIPARVQTANPTHF